MPQKLKYLGVPVFLDGQNYYIPSLSYRDFKANYDFLTSLPDLDGAKLFDYYDALIPVIGLAVRRNYSDVTDEQLTGWLDMNTLPLISKAMQGASGMAPVAEGE
jgi:hypothetical protein